MLTRVFELLHEHVCNCWKSFTVYMLTNKAVPNHYISISSNHFYPFPYSITSYLPNFSFRVAALLIRILLFLVQFHCHNTHMESATFEFLARSTVYTSLQGCWNTLLVHKWVVNHCAWGHLMDISSTSPSLALVQPAFDYCILLLYLCSMARWSCLCATCAGGVFYSLGGSVKLEWWSNEETTISLCFKPESCRLWQSEPLFP